MIGTRAQLRFGAALIAGPVVLAAAALGHASWLAGARSAPADEATRLVRTLGFVDLALSSDARWLRHPSLAEPWAAVTDAPAGFDVEPAGALVGSPGNAAELREPAERAGR